MNNEKDPSVYSIAELHKYTKNTLAELAKEVADGKVWNHQTDKRILKAYLQYEQGDTTHTVPIKLHAIAYDDRQNPGTTGDIAFRMIFETGGEECKEAALPLADLLKKAGFHQSEDSGKRLNDYINGRLGVEPGTFYVDTNSQSHISEIGNKHQSECGVVINALDLERFQGAFATPATAVSSILPEQQRIVLPINEKQRNG